MKAYREKLKSYRNKCQSLEMDKESLKNEKYQLEREVSRLKEQLDAVSITSHNSSLSHHKGLCYSCSSLYERDLVIVSIIVIMSKCSVFYYQLVLTPYRLRQLSLYVCKSTL